MQYIYRVYTVASVGEGKKSQVVTVCDYETRDENAARQEFQTQRAMVDSPNWQIPGCQTFATRCEISEPVAHDFDTVTN